mgnify:CR=1 FL=1
MSDFKDFHKVKNMLFNVSKLKKGLEEVLKIKNYDSANKIKDFAAICLNRIPGKPESTKGNYARGVYWTKPDRSGRSFRRDQGRRKPHSAILPTAARMGRRAGIQILNSPGRASGNRAGGHENERCMENHEAAVPGRKQRHGSRGTEQCECRQQERRSSIAEPQRGDRAQRRARCDAEQSGISQRISD